MMRSRPDRPCGDAPFRDAVLISASRPGPLCGTSLGPGGIHPSDDERRGGVDNLLGMGQGY
jgi:hypothetical protein